MEMKMQCPGGVPNPQECKCPLLEEEIWKCGPCRKCCQRADIMHSSFMDLQGNQRSRGAHGKETVHMAQALLKTRSQWVAAGDPVTVSTETTVKGRHRPKYVRTDCCRGNNGKTSPTEGSVGVPGTDMDAQTSLSSPSSAGQGPVTSQEKPWSLPYSMHDLRKKQLKDSGISPVLRWL